MADPWHKTCLRCGGEMTEGYILDVTDSGKRASNWIEGPPEKDFWGSVKTGGKRQFPLTAYRCAQCGAVDFYAQPAGG